MAWSTGYLLPAGDPCATGARLTSLPISQGSDQMGTNLTRRFVCEAMSFTHRYVPVGLLERLPTYMNERAFPYKGRDELEVGCSFIGSMNRSRAELT